ncbi:MAG: YhcH/YjgK/YiaL family protein [Lachnospiraceae bacterium]|nr:YhcH/YjgK/YiaL family protein [Lachnospiraceae bacterium]MDY5742568.1 YhcH/YjgK/YiaL family protein [Lachnospiraceae bacterium]
MIYDQIKYAERYLGSSRWLDAALHFMMETDLKALPLGRIEIAGEHVFANVMEATAIDESRAAYEIHKRYMDIQIDISGCEAIGFGIAADGEQPVFDEERDFGNVYAERTVTCTLGPGRFVVCMPEEPHSPSIAVSEQRALRKCVIKVATAAD